MTSAEELIGKAKALLLDFDGPITTLMPPPLNAHAADGVRAALVGIELPDEVIATTDHLAVLRFAAEHVPDRLQVIERACAEVEMACARKSDPSPEIRDLLSRAERADVPVAIVSNNSEAAVRVFLERFDWAGQIKVLSCRTPARVSRMKPDPYFVAEAARRVGVPPARCVLVGDSVADVQAGHGAGTLVVGLAKTPDRGSVLANAGSDALILRPPDGGPL